MNKKKIPIVWNLQKFFKINEGYIIKFTWKLLLLLLFHSFRCKSTLEKHTQLCKDHNFFKIKLPENNKKIKEHKFGSKALRMNDIIYVDLECLLVNYDTCSNDPNKSHTINIVQHMPSGYSITTLRNHNNSTRVIKYRGEGCIQKLCSELRSIGTELFDT